MAGKLSRGSFGIVTNGQYSAGSLVHNLFTHDFKKAAAIGDIIEIGMLPAGSYVVDAYVTAEGDLTGARADIGILSGEFGSADQARTCGDEFFTNVDLADASSEFQRMTKASGALVKPFANHRGIGLKLLAAAVPAPAPGAIKRVSVAITSTQ